jgi:hypothetical protein
VYRFEATKKGKVGYRYRPHDVIADVVYSLLLLLVYLEIVLVFRIELVIGDKLVCV